MSKIVSNIYKPAKLESTQARHDTKKLTLNSPLLINITFSN